MNWKDAREAVRAGWFLLLGGLLAGLLIGGLVNWFSTPQYSSSTRLFVGAVGATGVTDALSGDELARTRVDSYAQLLTTQALAARVVDDLKLSQTPDEVAREVSSAVVPKTVLIDVTVTDSSPVRARDIAASLTRLFAEQVAELETPAAGRSPTARVTVVQPPLVPISPVSPNVVRNLGFGAVLGLVVGLVLALVRHRLDRKVRTRQDIDETTGSNLIGTVLEEERFAEGRIVMAQDGPSSSAEAFRAIRTELQVPEQDGPARVILVTSPGRGEGKTTLAINVALAFAQAGRRVLLVDANLRWPHVAEMMGVAGRAGLADVLSRTAEPHEVAQPWGVGGLTVVSAGMTPAFPSELLGSEPMRTLLKTWRETYEIVVLDSPPLLQVTDAAVLGALCDGCLLTARFGETSREQLADAASRLRRLDVPLLGVVLNAVPRSAARRGGLAPEHAAEQGPRFPRVLRSAVRGHARHRQRVPELSSGARSERRASP